MVKSKVLVEAVMAICYDCHIRRCKKCSVNSVGLILVVISWDLSFEHFFVYVIFYYNFFDMIGLFIKQECVVVCYENLFCVWWLYWVVITYQHKGVISMKVKVKDTEKYMLYSAM